MKFHGRLRGFGNHVHNTLQRRVKQKDLSKQKNYASNASSNKHHSKTKPGSPQARAPRFAAKAKAHPLIGIQRLIFQLLVHMDGAKDQSSSKKKMSVVIGPWGGNSGTAWDDGIHDGVREITLVYDRCIDSIKVIYEKNGKPVTAQKHGGNGGNRTAEIKLKFPEEFLISATGHYCPVVHGGSPVIRSLTFKSNQRTFGPYGVEEGTPFTFSVEGGRITGFNGRSGWYLDSIGFRLSRVQSPKLFQKVQKGFQRLTSSVSKGPA